MLLFSEDSKHYLLPGRSVSALLRTWIVPTVQNVFLFAASGAIAFLLQFNFSVSAHHLRDILSALVVWVVVKTSLFAGGKISYHNWRNASVPDVLAISGYNACGSLLAFPIIWLLGPSDLPKSLYVLDLILCMLIVPAVYMFARLLAELRTPGYRKETERILIYGAGSGGAMVARELRRNPELGYQVCGFVDDDPDRQHTMTQRVRVLGTGENLKPLVRRHSISQVLIAVPSGSSDEMTRMLQYCREAQVPCKTVPGIAELIGQDRLYSLVREVAMEDLLGRRPVQLAEDDIRNKIRGRTVMVTGAGGSIGSELCRQLVRFEPKAIVGFDISETALFQIQQEMFGSFREVPFIPEVGNIQNRRRLLDVLNQQNPSMLYHAAAYKHVPMMEDNIFEAVENNVLGTATVAQAAEEAGIHDFVMISSDKAVNPVNIMGATKRGAELVIRDMKGCRTKYVSVRFGNVLGSSGSVVPTFKQQIAKGGPVTVTHPEMRRYFMTIPEAVQLVIQASTMGNGGEIFVLDMGDPVKIVDLARRLILLSGLRPDHDIRIEFTGARPGEKLYEELNLDEEATLPTFHPKIKVFGSGPRPEDLAVQLKSIQALCQSRDELGLLAALCRLVPDYAPGIHLTANKVIAMRRRREAVTA